MGGQPGLVPRLERVRTVVGRPHEQRLPFLAAHDVTLPSAGGVAGARDRSEPAAPDTAASR